MKLLHKLESGHRSSTQNSKLSSHIGSICKSIPFILAIGGATQSASAQEVSSHVDLLSEYTYQNGINASPNPVIQGGLSYHLDTKNQGAYGSLWVSKSLTNTELGKLNFGDEININGGYKFKERNGWQLHTEITGVDAAKDGFGNLDVVALKAHLKKGKFRLSAFSINPLDREKDEQGEIIAKKGWGIEGAYQVTDAVNIATRFGEEEFSSEEFWVVRVGIREELLDGLDGSLGISHQFEGANEDETRAAVGVHKVLR